MKAFPLLPIIRLPLLLLVVATGCSEQDEGPPDYQLDRIRHASRLTLDAQTTAARTLTLEQTRAFLAEFERDTFAPGPRSVRITHDCHRGSMLVAGVTYAFAHCRLKGEREVLEIGTENGVVRLVKSIQN